MSVWSDQVTRLPLDQRGRSQRVKLRFATMPPSWRSQTVVGDYRYGETVSPKAYAAPGIPPCGEGNIVKLVTVEGSASPGHQIGPCDRRE